MKNIFLIICHVLNVIGNIFLISLGIWLLYNLKEGAFGTEIVFWKIFLSISGFALILGSIISVVVIANLIHYHMDY